MMCRALTQSTIRHSPRTAGWLSRSNAKPVTHCVQRAQSRQVGPLKDTIKILNCFFSLGACLRRFDFIQTREQSHFPQICDPAAAELRVVKISLTKPALSKYHVRIVLIIPVIHIDLRHGVSPLPTAPAVRRE